MAINDSAQPIANLEYNLLTVLQNKSEAAKAYESYIQDAEQTGSQPCAQLVRKLHPQDLQQAQETPQHLQQVMTHGKM